MQAEKEERGIHTKRQRERERERERDRRKTFEKCYFVVALRCAQ
jgi:hypothetical protein